MAKQDDSGKGIALAILGIVAVIAVVGLVLLFWGAGSATGRAGDEQPYAKLIGGKNVNTYKCPESCGGRRGAGKDSIECTVSGSRANKPATLELGQCPGKEPNGKSCECRPARNWLS